jgi:hypothetical protein
MTNSCYRTSKVLEDESKQCVAYCAASIHAKAALNSSIREGYADHHTLTRRRFEIVVDTWKSSCQRRSALRTSSRAKEYPTCHQCRSALYVHEEFVREDPFLARHG